jgi:hypothetical protein
MSSADCGWLYQILVNLWSLVCISGVLVMFLIYLGNWSVVTIYTQLVNTYSFDNGIICLSYEACSSFLRNIDSSILLDTSFCSGDSQKPDQVSKLVCLDGILTFRVFGRLGYGFVSTKSVKVCSTQFAEHSQWLQLHWKLRGCLRPRLRHLCLYTGHFKTWRVFSAGMHADPQAPLMGE